MASEGSGVTTGQPNLHKQDLSKLDVSKLTALSPEVISRQATINIGTIGHVAHGKSTVVKAISGVQTVRFKNELERNITIKLERLKFDVNGRVILPQELTSQGITSSARVVRKNKRRQQYYPHRTRGVTFDDYLVNKQRKRKRTSKENYPERAEKQPRIENASGIKLRSQCPPNEQIVNHSINDSNQSLSDKSLSEKETQTDLMEGIKTEKFEFEIHRCLKEMINLPIGYFMNQQTNERHTDLKQMVLRERDTNITSPTQWYPESIYKLSRRKLSKQKNDYCLTDDESEDESMPSKDTPKKRTLRISENNKENVQKENQKNQPEKLRERRTIGVLSEIENQKEGPRPRRSCSANIDYKKTRLMYPQESQVLHKQSKPKQKPLGTKNIFVNDKIEDLTLIDTEVITSKLHLNIGSSMEKMWNNIENNVYTVNETTELTQKFNGVELCILLHSRKTDDTVIPNPVAKAFYEVEAIVGIRMTFNSEEYLVKWVGYPSESNTWEPYSHLTGSSEALSEFFDLVLEHIAWDALVVKFGLNADIPDATLSQLLPPGGFAKLESNKTHIQRQLMLYYAKQPKSTKIKMLHHAMSISLHYELILRRKRQQRMIKNFEANINNSRGNNMWIKVQNDVDLTTPPADFIYVTDYVMSEDINVDTQQPPGCSCVDLCPQGKGRGCCSKRENNVFAYTLARRIRIAQGFPIYECNKSCKCSMKCRNRVVQHGCQVKLAIFRTSNECGWGVKALQSIRKGEFVCQYVGEVITHEEAEARGQVYDSNGMTYLFDLDFDSPDNLYTVDAAIYGNVSHFINHSCDPNLGVWAVWIDCMDRNLPNLALFALRDIKKNEELTFDYMCDNGGGNKHSPVASPENKSKVPHKALCRCNSYNCRRTLF
ncbi:uncharacterized protein [Atheta coriaria]|uniref:uncharacterized protein isoform X1 n=1 Tax=Dalotia coriaria TaxID=877792 RepID=UPI0031F3B2C1